MKEMKASLSNDQGISIGWLTVNRNCNNRCEWCYAMGTEFKGNSMSLTTAENLINFYSELNVKKVVLIGGEPTVYCHLIKVVKMLFKKEIEPVLISNGRKFSDPDYAKKIVDSGLSNINFSEKAANREQYKKLTKRDGYEEVLKGFQNLRNLGVDVLFSTTIVSELIPNLKELFQNLFDAGVSRFAIDFGGPVISKSLVTGDGIPDPFESVKALTTIHDLFKDREFMYNFHVSIPLCLIPEGVKKILIKENRITTCCHLTSSSGLVFGPQGQVIPCNHLFDFPLGKFGEDFNNIKEFEKFWKSKKVQNFRQACFRYPTERCMSCKDWGICGGGCPIRWLLWEPSDFIKEKGEKK